MLLLMLLLLLLVHELLLLVRHLLLVPNSNGQQPIWSQSHGTSRHIAIAFPEQWPEAKVYGPKFSRRTASQTRATPSVAVVARASRMIDA